MDQLDFKIFRTLGLRPSGNQRGDSNRLNPWVIAKKLGVDGNTVKLRLAKMKKSGFIRYFQIYPNYHLLGIGGGSAYLFELDDPEKKNAIINQCALVDGVTEITNFVGNEVCIDFTYHDPKDESRRLKLLLDLTNCKRAEKFYDRVMPPVRFKLSNTDWRIIKSLRYNAFKPLPKVAQELGLSTKTVRRRFQRVIDNNAVVIVPAIQPGDVPNTITHVLLLYFKESKREQALMEALHLFEDKYFLIDTTSEGNAMLGLVAQTLAETEENFISSRKIEGVRNVKMLILKETQDFSEWLDQEIETKIAETSKLPHTDIGFVASNTS
jgi:DNA-binding Lrp family transcriptional regulator